MKISFANTITADQVNAIRKAMGWRQNHPEQVKDGLDGSTLIVAAYDGLAAVGMARLVWDGGGAATVHDILVLPEYQNLGIESQLLNHIFSHLQDKLKPGYGIQVDIRAWSGQVLLFEGLGFQVSATEKRGVPMHICLTDQIELTDAMFKQMDFSEV